jgi:hypothetical protein
LPSLGRKLPSSARGSLSVGYRSDARMSGDTVLAIIAVSLTAIFISVFAIECDRVWQRYRASRRREMEERAFSRRHD